MVDASDVFPISDVVLFHCRRVRSDYNLPNILFSRLLRLAICPSAAGCGWLDLTLVWYRLIHHVVQLGLEHAQYQRVMCDVCLLHERKRGLRITKKEDENSTRNGAMRPD